jgi:hypothetical protein
MHGSELIEYCQQVCFFQIEQRDVIFIKFNTFDVAFV